MSRPVGSPEPTARHPRARVGLHPRHGLTSFFCLCLELLAGVPSAGVTFCLRRGWFGRPGITPGRHCGTCTQRECRRRVVGVRARQIARRWGEAPMIGVNVTLDYSDSGDSTGSA